MSAVYGYHAGSSHALPFHIHIQFFADSPAVRKDMITRWIEFWCQKNCGGEWSVSEYDTHVEVMFADEQDLVHFKLSPEFDWN